MYLRSHTDINGDGAMAGPNIFATREIADEISIPVIASGGISSIGDLKALKSCGSNLNGVISGRALYEQTITVTEAIDCLRS